MPKVSSDTVQVHGPVEVREEVFDGYELSCISFREDVDAAPLLEGLPDDRCQCPHWGYVLEGRVSFGFADRIETFEAGDAFYVAPGHVPTADAGTAYVQFSPADLIEATNEAIQANLERMQRA